MDDQTSEPINDFVVQLSATNPQNPEEIYWSQEFHGPLVQRPGWFELQSFKKGKTWARVLADGYLPEPVTPDPVVSPANIADSVVRLKRGGELRGIVLDHARKPVVGARVFLTGTQRLELTDGKPNWVFKGSTATTDAEGCFALHGVGGTEQKRVVVSADSLQCWPVPELEPGQELKITLPQPATLIVRYDIPDDVPKAQLRLQLMSSVNNVTCLQEPTVANQGQIILTNLAPGNYDFTRTKTLRVGGESHGIFYDLLTVVLRAGETQRVDFVRATGHPIQGEVSGLKDVKGAFIYVRSAEATGHTLKMDEWKLPIFDAVTCDEAGHFSTARLAPGNYTIIVEAFGPETPSQIHNTGIRLPDYIGMAKVMVNAAAPPTPVKIELQLRGTRAKTP